MDTLELLTRARERIAKGWTQDVAARDWQGRAVPARSAEASAWCALGACEAGSEYRDDTAYCNAAFELMRALLADGPPPMEPELYVAAWNDALDRTQAEVLALYDRAILAAE